MNDRRIDLIPIREFPLVKPGDDVSKLIISTIKKDGIELFIGDIIVVTHSIVSIAEGKLYHIEEVKVTEIAKTIADKVGHSPERVEVALREASEIIRKDPILITKTKLGIITDFSGIDESNAPSGTLIALPDDPDESAQKISDSLTSEFGFRIPVIITDTHGRPWRRGAVNLAIGVAGMSPFTQNVGKEDIFGNELRGSAVCLADELASSAELVMGQSNEGVPVIIIRGVEFEMVNGSAGQIIRSDSENLFG